MTNEELEQIKAANKLKTTTVTVAARVPQWLKGQVLQKADESGTTVGEYIALLLYADSNGELLRQGEKGKRDLQEEQRQEEIEQELKSQIEEKEKTISENSQEAHELREEVNRLSKKVETLNRDKSRLQHNLEEYEEQLNRTKTQLNNKPSDNEIQELREWKDIAKKRQNIIQSKVQKMREMQRYINYKAAGLFTTPPHQFVGGGNIEALEEDEIEKIEERGPENAEKDNA
jgi:predicted RNase H-like nuclease (RuvC/YqgF family)